MNTGTVIMGIAAAIGLIWSVGSLAYIGYQLACRRRRDVRDRRLLTRKQVME